MDDLIIEIISTNGWNKGIEYDLSIIELTPDNIIQLTNELVKYYSKYTTQKHYKSTEISEYIYNGIINFFPTCDLSNMIKTNSRRLVDPVFWKIFIAYHFSANDFTNFIDFTGFTKYNSDLLIRIPRLLSDNNKDKINIINWWCAKLNKTHVELGQFIFDLFLINQPIKFVDTITQFDWNIDYDRNGMIQYKNEDIWDKITYIDDYNIQPEFYKELLTHFKENYHIKRLNCFDYIIFLYHNLFTESDGFFQTITYFINYCVYLGIKIRSSLQWAILGQFSLILKECPNYDDYGYDYFIRKTQLYMENMARIQLEESELIDKLFVIFHLLYSSGANFYKIGSTFYNLSPTKRYILLRKFQRLMINMNLTEKSKCLILQFLELIKFTKESSQPIIDDLIIVVNGVKGRCEYDYSGNTCLHKSLSKAGFLEWLHRLQKSKIKFKWFYPRLWCNKCQVDYKEACNIVENTCTMKTPIKNVIKSLREWTECFISRQSYSDICAPFKDEGHMLQIKERKQNANICLNIYKALSANNKIITKAQLNDPNKEFWEKIKEWDDLDDFDKEYNW